MLEQLRIALARKKIFRAGLLMLIAMIATVNFWPGYVTLLQGPQDLYTLDTGDLEGRYVAARIDIIYDWYAESVRRGDDSGTPVQREYIIPAGGSSFIGLEISSDLFDAAGAVMDDTLAVQKGQSGTPGDAELVVRGTIRQMDEKTLSFYHEVVGYDSLSPEDQQRFLPLVLETDTIGRYPVSSLLLSALALAAFALPSLGLALSASLGKGPRQIVDYLGELSPARYEVVADDLDNFYDAAVPADRVRVNPRWLLYENGASSWLLSTNDVAWVYRESSRRGENIVVCSKSEPRHFSKHRIPVGTRWAADNLLGRLSAALPEAVFGYDPLWETLYDLDPNRFCHDIRATLYAAGPGGAPLYDAVREAPDLFPPRPGDDPPPRHTAPGAPPETAGAPAVSSPSAGRAQPEADAPAPSPAGDTDPGEASSYGQENS